MRSFGLVLALALVLTGLCAGTASATEKLKVKVSINCDSATYTYTGFPNANNNTVTEAVRVDGALVARQVFTFNGPTATNTVFFTPISGTHEVFARVEYHTNGVNGEYDRAKVILTCEPGFTIEKLQQIEGSGKPFTTSPLTGKEGQTVDYQIVVKNTGNAPLTFSEFTDEKCTNIAGGPGATPVAIGESTTYTCEHLLNSVGEYTNAATVTGTPEGGTPITHTSNTVVVTVVRLAPKLKTKITCESVTFNFSGFPNENNNTVTEAIRVDGVLVYRQPFTFNGPSATNTVKFGPVGPGTHEIFARAEWHTNGFNGENDRGHVVLNCDKPAFTIEKLQQIEGSGKPFTSSQLEGIPGQTVDYQIVVNNTGNVPLAFSGFTDEKCTNIAGGPGATPVAPGESTTYTCEQLLTTSGEYTNAATDTGTAEGDPPVTHTSNTVVVLVP